MVRLQELLHGNPDKIAETRHLVGVTGETLAHMDSKQLEQMINEYKESYTNDTVIDVEYSVVEEDSDEE
jgi:hypothetical protein